LGTVKDGASLQGGKLYIEASTSINLTSADASSANGSAGTIGMVSLGDITVGTLSATSGKDHGTPGQIDLNAKGLIDVGSILESGGKDGGGTLKLTGDTGITANFIDTSASPFGDAGTVTLTSNGPIVVNSMLSQTIFGKGGTLNVQAPSFTAKGIVDFSSFVGPTGTTNINSPSVTLFAPIVLTHLVPAVPTSPTSSSITPTSLALVTLGAEVVATLSEVGTAVQAGSARVFDTAKSFLLPSLPSLAEQDESRVSLSGGISEVTMLSNECIVFDPAKLSNASMMQMQSLGVSLSRGADGNTFSFDKGNVVLRPSSDLVINAGDVKITVGAGTTVLLMKVGNDVVVCDLHDAHTGDVSVSAGRYSIKLTPGEQFLVTSNQTESFDSINPNQKVAYRNLSKHQLGNGKTGYLSEVSIVSALGAISAMQKLSKSSDPSDRRALAQMMKNAAIKSMMQNYKGPFKTGKP
ncbi:MAG: hypothetical protein K2X81_19535, partial [Candidatus Obscuribacterales bacterium]|nr:hypothetical protein [Candidatus Obscuribacterales bacterium]